MTWWQGVHRLSFGDRAQIAIGRQQGLRVRAIAKLIERAPSVVSRELARNVNADGFYKPVSAHDRAKRRRRRPKARKIAADDVLLVPGPGGPTTLEFWSVPRLAFQRSSQRGGLLHERVTVTYSCSRPGDDIRHARVRWLGRGIRSYAQRRPHPNLVAVGLLGTLAARESGE